MLSRLVSLTGTGGVGKTRLAVQLARDLVEQFPRRCLADRSGGAHLVPISWPQTIASALSIRESRERSVRDALVDTLRDRTLLLVLDNCEHLLEACAALVERSRTKPRRFA